MRQLDETSTQQFVANFSSAKLLCMGDVMIDRYIEGRVTRISPESPVPVFNIVSESVSPGGAANVARNISALGGSCVLLSVVGTDPLASELADALRLDIGLIADFVPAPGRPTTNKTRFVTNGHHMLRVDSEVVTPIDEAVQAALIARLEERIQDTGALILSDYAKGLLTDSTVRAAIAVARRAGKPIIVDPKVNDLSRFAGATVLTPNAKEAHELSGVRVETDDDAERAGQIILDMVDVGAVLITRSERGMSLMPRGGTPRHIPSVGREVFDVVGAGDTVIATLALGLAVGAGLETSAFVANIAAGIVVGKRGTATSSQDELNAGLGLRAPQSQRRARSAIMTLAEAVSFTRGQRSQGKTIGFTNGVFDILHPGHTSLLQFCRDNCDVLIVGVNGDDSVRRLKGPARPINPEADRATLISAMAFVDGVVVFDDDTPISIIEAIKPDVLIKGADYTLRQIVGADIIQAYGGQVLRFELVPGVSSTKIIAKMRPGP